ncbi:MAG: hypothetical protein A2268_04275 [Candidatus Raymondbacteria bacterium RifOxyA12_full_50_37]|uniref:Secretion system C-terminal sorting domain-containing protein n=1 Tax=Candidatus Raymondbacteria bacterium RIFOXYD12_FULL_49_13 TaxID=1817890 RepID=A0A1F7FBH0_UNCRA|nr:MAG: hypothetical protein A2268_04275 [Candidatus Raymondbacteria bacterium RifOxyA12_full_50_37]OGJ92272.1 MAG: hypothetical protein A2350_14800 [Candidatus Raymondbacteria bacterium RifOxyB12_full_50_8]OGJ92560.1 MAG: hypothetical protein A2248_05675 [Candidatus Raymondbacteria bacterium RIFOXYA2_FULL_49_16]OGJ97914.1 MAG: hypothetical protein A2453_02700 [Candidatus Raymondbacteria bacterium RIFOXYC2_FULL_50_21]OGK03971.1 MAG: hypothetical protein A2519_04585 [Candidatus Raymondbacteria b
MIKNVLIAVVTLIVSVQAETYLFWQDAIKNNYALADSPGPNLQIPQDKIYEGLLHVDSYNYRDGDPDVSTFILMHFFKTYIVSFDLNRVRGTITSAKLRGEFLDLYYPDPGIAMNRSGDIQTMVSISKLVNEHDFCGSGYLSADYFACDSRQLSIHHDICSEFNKDTITFITFQGQTSDTSQPSPLWRKFAEIDITDQVQWILDNNDSMKTGAYQIILAGILNSGNGKMSLFGYGSCDSLIGDGANAPEHWTQDGNTMHIVVEGTLTPEPTTPISDSPKECIISFSLQNFPNPFNPITNIAYEMNENQKGLLTIYAINGKPVFYNLVEGKGVYSWNASRMASGVYFCRLVCNGKALTRKVVLFN